jgi:hypothetical protein
MTAGGYAAARALLVMHGTGVLTEKCELGSVTPHLKALLHLILFLGGLCQIGLEHCKGESTSFELVDQEVIDVPELALLIIEFLRELKVLHLELGGLFLVSALIPPSGSDM